MIIFGVNYIPLEKINELNLYYIIMKLKKFIKQANTKSKKSVYKYDFSNIKRVNKKTKVKIICPCIKNYRKKES